MAFKQLKLWFDGDLANMLAEKIIEWRPDFDSTSFIQSVSKGVPDLELKQRVELIADSLNEFLGQNYQPDVDVLIKILGPENTEEMGMFSNFYWVMPIAKYVEKYGLDSFEISMHAIEEITKRNTGEYAIRPYLIKYPAECVKQMSTWASDTNFHVRRLASEGIRPRLPWASKLDMFIQDPSPILPILDQLKDDSSKYVQKSVANCLNDILKDNPAIAMPFIESWCTANMSVERKWIIKHALRNLVKKGDDWANQIFKK